MTSVNTELDSLLRAARQILQGERALAGSSLPRGLNCLRAPQAAVDPPAGPVRHILESTPAPPGAKAAALEAIDVLEVRGCTKCQLCRSRTQTVFGEGDPDAALMFVGEGPGADEDAVGRPFVGRAGQKLDEMIAAMGLKREQVYIANVVKCRPPGNRTPLPEEAQACWSYLERQIAIIQPQVIVVLGNAAAKMLLHTTIGITKLRGQWQKLGQIDVMPTFHPAYLLRQYTPENRRRVWDDLKAVMKRLNLP